VNEYLQELENNIDMNSSDDEQEVNIFGKGLADKIARFPGVPFNEKKMQEKPQSKYKQSYLSSIQSIRTDEKEKFNQVLQNQVNKLTALDRKFKQILSNKIKTQNNKAKSSQSMIVGKYQDDISKRVESKKPKIDKNLIKFINSNNADFLFAKETSQPKTSPRLNSKPRQKLKPKSRFEIDMEVDDKESIAISDILNIMENENEAARQSKFPQHQRKLEVEINKSYGYHKEIESPFTGTMQLNSPIGDLSHIQIIEQVKEEVNEEINEETNEKATENMRIEVNDKATDNISIEVNEKATENVSTEVNEKVNEKLNIQVNENMNIQVNGDVNTEVNEDVNTQVNDAYNEINASSKSSLKPAKVMFRKLENNVSRAERANKMAHFEYIESGLTDTQDELKVEYNNRLKMGSKLYNMMNTKNQIAAHQSVAKNKSAQGVTPINMNKFSPKRFRRFPRFTIFLNKDQENVYEKENSISLNPQFLNFLMTPERAEILDRRKFKILNFLNFYYRN
jgi:hypothetical protein